MTPADTAHSILCGLDHEDRAEFEALIEQAIIAAVAEKDARINELEAAVAHLRACNAALTSKIRANSNASSVPQAD